jgi:hypothetical protein
MKPKLVVLYRRPDLASWANSPQLRSVLEQYFDFEDYSQDRHYSKDTWFVILANYYEGVKEQFQDHNVIIDVCCEANMSKWDRIYKDKISHHVVMYGNVPTLSAPDLIHVPNFFWYHEALNLPLDFDHQPNYKHKFLMPIGRKTKLRDRVVERLTPLLDDAYWSYVRRGQVLPGEPESLPTTKRYDTRYDNPMWYNDTCFSVVLESVTDYQGSVPFLTEKIYKPIRHLHPYIAIGAPGILKYLRSQGFETYNNLFDESYDDIEDLDQRMSIIEKNIQEFKKVPYDAETLRRAQHNQQLFYNVEHIHQDIKKSIVEPVFELLEKQ